MTRGASESSAGTQPLGAVPMPKARRGTHRPAPPTERRTMTLTIADLRALLAERLAQRSHYRMCLAFQFPDDDGVNVDAADLLASWSAEMAAMPDSDPALAELAEAVLATGEGAPRAALDALGIELYKALSRAGFARGPATLPALLAEWSETAAAGSLQHGGA
jgi:hypothetical protein